MVEIKKVADKYNLIIVEDCAQSHGACFGDNMTGTFGEIGCFSFYPSKNIGAFGDGGAIVTQDKTIADKIRVLRNYGSEKRYYNSVGIGTIIHYPIPPHLSQAYGYLGYRKGDFVTN